MSGEVPGKRRASKEGGVCDGGYYNREVVQSLEKQHLSRGRKGAKAGRQHARQNVNKNW
jgi:hypothetical protein